jgi:hypothetical protein
MTSPLWGKIYPEEELKRISNMKETGDKYEELFKQRRKAIKDRIEPILSVLYQKNFTSNNSKEIIDAQAQALSLRQEINENISIFSQRLAKAKSDNAVLQQEKFLLFSTNFGLKTNLGEKKLLIEGNMRENERVCNILEIHIQFLRDTMDTLESFQYSVKNVISLIEYLGR